MSILAILCHTRKLILKKIHWIEKKPTVRGKQRRQDIIKGKPGVTEDAAKSADTPRKSFELFFTDEMMETKMTNKKINKTLERLSDVINTSNKYPYLKTMDVVEMNAFIGLMYIRGLLG